MPALSFFGGVNEIGGNKILFDADGTRILLDFGLSFAIAGRYFDEYLQPRKCAALTDFFELGLLPDLRGIYREDYLRHMGRPAEERHVDAVLLTHAHADHAQHIHFLRPDIPLHCTEATRIILNALEVTGRTTFTDLATTCEAFTFYETKKGTLGRASRRNVEFVRERVFNVMAADERATIGSVEVELVPVDHSLPGACGFIIYTEHGNLVYTGDIRFHGSNRALSEHFVAKAKAAQPAWLVTEGTRIEKTEQDSEAAVKHEMIRLFADAKGLIFVEHPIRDLDRVTTIFEATRANDREFVVPLKLAYLLQALGDLAPFPLSAVKILIPKKSWGLIDRKELDWNLIAQDYEPWERVFLSSSNALTCRELREHSEQYVVSMNFWEITQLTDIQPAEAIWIKSSCEPFSDEMELDEARKRHWLTHFGITEFHAHASGHASGPELQAMISEINPEHVFPVHTEHPELFTELNQNVQLPERGKTYRL